VPSQSAGNPYLASLAVAQTIIVSGDSVNMVSEAAATNKPVLVRLPPNLKSKRLLAFNRQMVEQKMVAPFNGDNFNGDNGDASKANLNPQPSKFSKSSKSLQSPQSSKSLTDGNEMKQVIKTLSQQLPFGLKHK